MCSVKTAPNGDATGCTWDVHIIHLPQNLSSSPEAQSTTPLQRDELSIHLPLSQRKSSTPQDSVDKIFS